MDLHGGIVVARFLAERQVACLFTLCGGHISPILVAAKTAGIHIVDMRHEANTVFAADAVSRLTGRPGVAAVTAGPGVTNTVTALKNAAMAQSPVILIGGAAPTVLKGRGALQDIDQLSLLRPVVKQAVTIKRNCDILPVLESAFQTATSGVPGPVFVECPIDLLYPESMVRDWYGGQKQDTPPRTLRERLLKAYLGRHVDRMFACSFETMEASPWSPSETTIDTALVTKTADILRKSRQPVAIVGSQALLHTAQAPALARALEQIGVPVYLTGMARGLMGPNHVLAMRHQRRKALKAADTVLIAGMPCDFRLDYGRAIARQARVIGINRSRRDLRLNRTPQLAVAADPGRFLKALAEEGSYPQERWTPWLATLRQREEEREAAIQVQAAEIVDGINPLHFLKALDDFLDDRALLVADGGDFVASAAYTLRPRGPLSWLDPGVFGTLGVGAGFAAGAKLCRPDAEVWLIYGDGSAGYTLAEFDTLVRHKLPVIAVVGNDAGWSQIARDQVTYLQDDVATVLAPTAYDRVVEGLGAKGISIARPEEIVPALEEARRTAAGGRPVLINVHIGRTGFRDGSISM
jgi:thiamine pyrophosphate-dependent acetolactate synthase large subunit-like protein